MIVSAFKVDPLNSTLYIMNTTWKPLPTQLGVNLICYTPVHFSLIVYLSIFSRSFL